MDSAKQKKSFNEDATVDLYYRDISNSQGLPSEKEAELSQKIQKGDKKALNTLIEANLRFVVKVAQQYKNQGLPLADLINEGNYGLIKAAQKFNGTKNIRFISYAVWWIRQSILHALAEQSRIVRLPLNRVNQICKMRQQREKLEQQHKRAPDYEELNSQGFVQDSWDLYKLQNIELRPLALDAPINIKGNNTHLDIMADENAIAPDCCLEDYSLKQEAEKILNKLGGREREVFERLFGFNGYHPHTLGEVGGLMKLSRERVRQIKAQATNRIQYQLKQERANKKPTEDTVY